MNRKNRSYLPIATALVLTGASGTAQQKQPNVIYIFPDQFRNHAMEFWNDAAFKDKVDFKADPVITPHLNAFAKESLVLTQAMSNCPLSSPHRGMLLTGMYPDGSGVPLNCNSDRPFSTLNENAECVSDVFSQNGYNCAYIGKLHLDFPTPNNPQKPGTYVEEQRPVWDAYTPKERRHGFDFWYSYGTFDEHKKPHYWDTNGERHEIREWSPKHESDVAIAYLENKKGERNGNKPFFMMVSMNPPHSPYTSLDDCMEEDYNLYKNIPLNKLLVRPNTNAAMPKATSTPYYFASITGVDREFGRILKKLKELGLDENTIIVFSSDHGETMCSQNITDPKNSPYAESMNVPFLVRYPQKITPRTDNLLLSSPDIMPTLLGLAGLSKQIPQAVQGTDYSALFLNPKSKNKRPSGALYLRNINGEKNANGSITSYFPVARGIKTDRYTLAITIDRKNNVKEILLFDDKKDPYQMKKLNATENPQILKSLYKEMASLLKQANDPWYRQRILSQLIPYTNE